MCNSIAIQRRVALDRCHALVAKGASLEHVLSQAWNAGFCEADRDTGASSDAEFDRRVDEINREMEAIESGSVEPSNGLPIRDQHGRIINWNKGEPPHRGEFPLDRAEDMDDAARDILLANLRAGCGR